MRWTNFLPAIIFHNFNDMHISGQDIDKYCPSKIIHAFGLLCAECFQPSQCVAM